MTEHIYASVHSPCLTLATPAGMEDIRFAGGSFRTDDADVAEYLDDLLARMPAISQQIRKIDMAEAERIAATYQSTIAAAIKGGLTSGSMREAIDKTLLPEGGNIATQPAPVPDTNTPPKTTLKIGGK